MTKTHKKKKIEPARLAFITASYLVIFLIGGGFAIKNWQPFTFISKGYSDTATLIKETRQTRPTLLLKKVYNGNGVIKHNASKSYNGLTLLQGTLPGGPQLRLIDMEGNEVHRWPVDFFTLWPKPTHLTEEQIPKSVFNYHTQGVELLRDGSVIFNIGDIGAAKLDKCGNIQWTVDRLTHHSITQTTDEGYWIPSHRKIDNIAEKYLFRGIQKQHLKNYAIQSQRAGANGYENLILRINDKGKIIREFSILKSMIDAGFESALYDTTLINAVDPTHVNEIEVVTKALADKIPGVNIDDILVSVRQMHLLMIMDQFTGEIKWSHRGNWIRQHDPDITPEGNIIVFNNGSPQFSFISPIDSSLVMLDPSNNSSTVVYPTGKQRGFFTDILGEKQRLNNGNYLITESRRGRAFEVSPSGEIVWDFVLPYDKTYASLIAISRRFPTDYFTVDNWSCQ